MCSPDFLTRSIFEQARDALRIVLFDEAMRNNERHTAHKDQSYRIGRALDLFFKQPVDRLNLRVLDGSIAGTTVSANACRHGDGV